MIFRSKLVYPDGSIREMVLWQLPRPTPDRPHGFKYRLYYGLADGTCLVRYDNETGKGDHRHYRKREEQYRLNVHVDVRALKNAGLIETDEDGKVLVPWDRIATEIPLAA